MKVEVFLPPESYARDTTSALSSIPESLSGLRIGLFENGKTGGELILQVLSEHLEKTTPGVEFVVRRKENASWTMSEEDLELLSSCDLVLSAVGDCGSCSSWTIQDAVTLEEAGIPVVCVCTKPFETFARAQATAKGMPDLRTLILDHPVAELDLAQIRKRVEPKLGRFEELLESGSDGSAAGNDESAPAERTASTEVVDIGEVDLMGLFESRGMFDGLPLVAPTPERIEEMLAQTSLHPDQVLGRVGPRYGIATPRNTAVAAVAAGCRPEYFPVVLAAMKAVIQPEFNLTGVQATTHPVAMFCLVSGPVTERIGMNEGTNAFGQGNRANATIGRALRLGALGLGGAWPGNGDMATHGTPAKYTFAAAENVSASPWGALATHRGFDSNDSVVTVVGSEGPQNINDHESSTGLGILRTMAGTMRSVGMNQHYYPDGQVVVAIGPEHASTLATDGYSRREIMDYLYNEARMPVSFFSEENVRNRVQAIFPKQYAQLGGHETVPMVQDPDNILVCVVGGVGKHSVFIPTFGATRACSEVVV